MPPVHTYAVPRRAVPPPSSVVSTPSEEIVPSYLKSMCIDSVFYPCFMHSSELGGGGGGGGV